MSEPSLNTSPVPADARPRPRLGVLLARALRAAVVLVILVMGLLLLQTYRAILHDAPARPVKVSETVAERQGGPQAETVPDFFLQPGAWSIGESSWAVTMVDLATAEGQARLQSLGFRGALDDKPSSLELTVLDWLHRSRPKIVDDCRVYEIAAGAVRIRAVTRTERGNERLQLVQGTWKRGGSSQMLEAMPAIGSGRVDTEHLLPLPPGVPSLARRWSSAGMLTGEMLGPTTRLEENLKEWTAAGWSVEQGPQLDASSPLRVLRKGGRVVRLISLQGGPQGLGNYLLLMAETPSQQGAS